jgi:hypothetical protein
LANAGSASAMLFQVAMTPPVVGARVLSGPCVT